MIDQDQRDEELFALRQECLRLQEELGRTRQESEQLRHTIKLVVSSWTWKASWFLNDLAARLLFVKRRAGAREQLERFSSVAVEQLHLDQLSVSESHAFEASAPEHMSRINGGWFDTRMLAEPRIGCYPESSELPERLPGLSTITSMKVARLQQLDGVILDLDAVSKNELPGLLDIIVSAGCGLGVANAKPLPDILLDWMPVVVDDYRGDEAINNALASIAANRGRWSPPLFDVSYLAGNPDVLRGMRRREIGSAAEHWRNTGKREFFQAWRTYHPFVGQVSMGLRTATDQLRAEAEREIAGWDSKPIISILVPVYKVDVRWLRMAVDSVVHQLYPHWQLCLVDDASDDPEIAAYLESLGDDRIRVRQLHENVGIAKASNVALEMAQGDFVALLDHDDELTLDALWLVARVIVTQNPDLIYSDEAKLEMNGSISEPHFKPHFSPEMVLSQNYISHLGVYRRSIVDTIGGFREGFEGSQDHDLLLRFLRHTEKVFHIPRVLYYWRKVPQSTAHRFGAKSHAWDAGVAAVQDFIDRVSPEATVEKGQYPGTYRVRHPIQGEPLISILIPFRDQPELLEQCLTSLVKKTGYENFEVLGINNQSKREPTLAVMEKWQQSDRRIRFLDFDAEFNFSSINNFGARQANGEHLLLLNNDVEVINEDWLEELLRFSQLPGVGAVGGQLLYPDNTLQHAGVMLGIGGVAGHSHKYFPSGHHGYFCRPHLIQNVSAVTGACLMVKRELYQYLGGLDEANLSVAFNDIDFCLRLLEHHYRNVYTPYAKLYHHESKSRGQEDTDAKRDRFNREIGFMKRRHLRRLSLGDPWYNPNLTLDHENFEVRKSPFRTADSGASESEA